MTSFIPAGLLLIHCGKKSPSSLSRHKMSSPHPIETVDSFDADTYSYFSRIQELYFRIPPLFSLFPCISLLPNSYRTPSRVIMFVHILTTIFFLFIILVWEHWGPFIYSLSAFSSNAIVSLRRHQCCDRLRLLVFCSLTRNRNGDLIERGCWGLLYSFLFRNKANSPYPKWYKCFCTVSVCEGKIRIPGEIGYPQKE